MARAITKAELLAAKTPLECVPVPEIGEDAALWVKAVSGWERAEIEKMFTDRQPGDDPGGFRGAVLVRCLCDEQGVRMFSQDDVKALLDMPSGILERLFEIGCRVNGFTRKDVEDLEKN